MVGVLQNIKICEKLIKKHDWKIGDRIIYYVVGEHYRIVQFLGIKIDNDIPISVAAYYYRTRESGSGVERLFNIKNLDVAIKHKQVRNISKLFKETFKHHF